MKKLFLVIFNLLLPAASYAFIFELPDEKVLQRFNSINKVVAGEWEQVCVEGMSCFLLNYSFNEKGLQLHKFYQDKAIPLKSSDALQLRMSGVNDILSQTGYQNFVAQIDNLETYHYSTDEMVVLYEDRMRDAKEMRNDRIMECFLVATPGCVGSFFGGPVGIISAPFVCGYALYNCIKILDDMREFQKRLSALEKKKKESDRSKPSTSKGGAGSSSAPVDITPPGFGRGSIVPGKTTGGTVEITDLVKLPNDGESQE